MYCKDDSYILYHQSEFVHLIWCCWKGKVMEKNYPVYKTFITTAKIVSIILKIG